jgi:hypothetical protein
MKKIYVLFLFITAVAWAQNPYPDYTGVILVNRTIGGTDVQPRWNIFTHTFVAYVEHGEVLATASWGNDAMIDGWHMALSPLDTYGSDFMVALQAFASGVYSRAGSGGDLGLFFSIFEIESSQPNHVNLGIAFNCKWEANAFCIGFSHALGNVAEVNQRLEEMMYNSQAYMAFGWGQYPSGMDGYAAMIMNFELNSVPAECRDSYGYSLQAIAEMIKANGERAD